MSKVIGIEIGSSTLKLATVKNGVVRRVAVERMPDGLVREGRVVSDRALTDFVKTMMRKHRIKGRECSLVLPPQTVVAQQVTVPVMSSSELRLNLPYEFRDYVGKDSGMYSYDYIVSDISDDIMNLYAAAVRKDLVERYYDVFKKAGMTLKNAMPVEMAWLNIVEQAPNIPQKFAILDIGHHVTRVSFFADGNYIMGKDIELGGQLLDEVIAMSQNVDPNIGRTRKEANMEQIHTMVLMEDPYNTIAMEVMKAINFYNFSQSSQDDLLRDIYFCGGTSLVEPLRNAIANATGMTLHHVSKLVNMGHIDANGALSCTLAVGAALQEIV